MLTTAASVDMEALAHLSTIWIGHDSDASFSRYIQAKPLDCVSKVVMSDLLTCRCCQVHDQCYSDAMQHSECWPILDNPYTELYHYTCDEANKKITCTSE